MLDQTGWKDQGKPRAGARKVWRSLMAVSGCIMLGLGMICSQIGWRNLAKEVPILLLIVAADLAIFMVSLICYFGLGSRRRREEKLRGRELRSIPFNPASQWDSWIAELYTGNQQKARKLYRAAAVMLAVCVIIGLYLAWGIRAAGRDAFLVGVNEYIAGSAIILAVAALCVFSSGRKKSRVSDGRQVSTEAYREQMAMPCLLERFQEARFLEGGYFQDALIRQSGVLGKLDYCSGYNLLAARYRGIYLVCGDVVAGYEYTTTKEDKEGRKTTETHNKTVSDGRWLQLHGHRQLSGHCICVWSKRFGKGRGRKTITGYGLHPVILEDDRFARLFEVYAYDATEAYGFLTPALMNGLERLLLTEEGQPSGHEVALVCAGDLIQVLIPDLPRSFVPDGVIRNLTQEACQGKIRGEIAVIADVVDSVYDSLV